MFVHSYYIGTCNNAETSVIADFRGLTVFSAVYIFTLCFHLEDTVLLIGTFFYSALYLSQNMRCDYKLDQYAKQAWLLNGLCSFTKKLYPTHLWVLLFIWSVLNQNGRCDYWLDQYAKENGSVLKVEKYFGAVSFWRPLDLKHTLLWLLSLKQLLFLVPGKNVNHNKTRTYSVVMIEFKMI